MQCFFSFIIGGLPALPLTIRTALAPVLREPANRRRRRVASLMSADPRDHLRRRPDYLAAAAVARQRDRNRARRTIMIMLITTMRAV